MEKIFETSLFVFRKDLRLFDNTALLVALNRSENVYPIFILDPRLIENNSNSNAKQFLIESLSNLEKSLVKKNGRINVYYGLPHEVIMDINNHISIDSLFVNIDYSPFSLERDSQIARMCQTLKIKYNYYTDHLLTHPKSVFTNQGGRYKVFTHYFKKAKQQDVKLPKPNTLTNYIQSDFGIDINQLNDIVNIPENKSLHVNGGRSYGLRLLNLVEKLENYEEDRNYPSKNGSSNLSSHIKFGTLSIREVYHHIKKTFSKDNPLIRQLYWRDFFVYLAYHNPSVYRNSFKNKYRNIEWEDNSNYFERWKEGNTGFPIIDAGMRQLNKTGFINNRVRMIVASFLVKDLHINWMKGERYFASKLIDYDPAVNNGNWQWVASTGADVQPYFRIFNPWTQQKKYDPECEYIFKWIPELQVFEPKDIHDPSYLSENVISTSYPKPIVNHKTRSKEIKSLFESIS